MKYLLPLVIMAATTSTIAQGRSTVTLTVTAMRPNPSAKTVTLTLASGTQITVPMSDVTSEPVATAAAPPVTPATPSAASQTDALINRKCAADWATDFRMQAFCRDQQREAVVTLQRRPMTSGDQRTIRANCQRQWTDDFRMQNFCEEQQLKALQSLGR